MIDSKKNKRLIAALLLWGILILASAISLWKLQKSVGNFDVSEMFTTIAIMLSTKDYLQVNINILTILTGTIYFIR